MQKTMNHEEFSQTISTATNEDQIIDALSQYARLVGIGKLAYHHLPPHAASDFDEKHFHARGYDARVIAEYKRNHAIFDSPLAAYVNVTSDPMTVKQACERLEYSAAQKAYFSEFFAPDHTTGFVIPAFGLKGRNGFFVLMAENEDTAFKSFDIRRLKWSCQESHLKISQMIVRKTVSSVSLTDREKEILTWVARGKSNSVIADIIGISPHTVNGYLRTVYLKTGVSDRTSAALIGVSNSLISV